MAAHPRKASLADARQLALVLARAFDADPMMNYLVKHDARRLERIELFFRAALTLGFTQDEVYTTEERQGVAILAVDPPAQSRGTSSGLLEPMLARCDEAKIGAYLETFNQRNLNLYRRHGFEVTREGELDGGAPKMWSLWREPR
jgi:GNAT superfamily N-acetyltransferase